MIIYNLHRLHLFNPLYNNGISRNLYQLKIDGWLYVNDNENTAFIFHVSTKYTEHWTFNSEDCYIRGFRHSKQKVLAFPLFVFFLFVLLRQQMFCYWFPCRRSSGFRSQHITYQRDFGYERMFIELACDSQFTPEIIYYLFAKFTQNSFFEFLTIQQETHNTQNVK